MSQLLGERYELQEQIGGGGMAVVYRAVDKLLNRQVAVKMLRPQYAGDEEFVRRFRREAQSAASLSHPNIVNLYDVGVTPNMEHYIVMEYVDGPTLKDVIRERAPLSVKETLDIARQICDALEHAHDHNIIHRDIKPHNILLTKSGHVKVTDFGIARASTGNTITHHQSHSVLGSVHYFSPEQARGAPTDVKSDIYSLGVVIYEMLTGRLPFSGDSPVSVALKHLRDKFVEPREINKSIPQSVENIVLRCLVKSPDARYPSMKALKADLKDALVHPNVPKFVPPDEVSDQTIAVPIIGGGNLQSAISGSNPEKEPEPKKRKWWTALAWSGVFVGVLCIGVVAAYYIVMRLIQVPDIALPDVRNKNVGQAVKLLEAAGVPDSHIKQQHEANAKPKDVVYDQDPEGPTHIKQGRDVTLYVSDGQQQIQMPDLTNVPFDQAKQELINLGIPKDNIIEQDVQSSQYDTGNVVATVPSANENITPNTKITVQVSQGSMATGPNSGGADGSSGNGLNNTSGTDNGGPSATPPANAKVKYVTVNVKDKDGVPIHVQIFTTDVTGTRTRVVDNTITATTAWKVTLYVTPDKAGEVMVYQNGQMTNDKTVSYQ